MSTEQIHRVMFHVPQKFMRVSAVKKTEALLEVQLLMSIIVMLLILLVLLMLLMLFLLFMLFMLLILLIDKPRLLFLLIFCMLQALLMSW